MAKIALVLSVLFSLYVCSYALSICASNPLYRMRMCTAATTILRKRAQCDITELEQLRKRARLLQGILNILYKQQQRRRAVTRQNGCVGKVFNNICYFILDQEGKNSMKPFLGAQSACNKMKATLAYIKSKAIYDFIYTYVIDAAKDFVTEGKDLVLFWTGASYKSGKIYMENNVTSNYANWSAHHPTNVATRNRIAVAVSTNNPFHGMFDIVPTLKLYPLCQNRINP